MEVLSREFMLGGNSSMGRIRKVLRMLKKKGQKVEVEMVHPWPEWIELMERLVQQNYFDHKRRDDEKMVEDLGFDMTNVFEEVKDDAGIDFKDYKTVQTACINSGKDQFDTLRFVRLIEGIIDQVEGTIHVSWVQPRVLGIPQIKSLHDWLDN
ncbi:hypothetical protein GOBAR_DD24195 [Gossypium barbadense]|nr:hypothetical protein GOBAR_DD24195 [Gossypium barbadense]